MRFLLPLATTLLLMATGSSPTLVAASTTLYVSAYAGTITTLQLSQDKKSGSYSLNISSIFDLGASPAWLTYDPKTKLLFCADEGLTAKHSSVAAFSTSSSGNVTLINRLTAIEGAVATVVYNGGKALAMAHYSGSALTTYAISSSGSLSSLENRTFTLSTPGPNASRQEAPHPHQALIDPTDRFVLVPDLGADLVRVFAIESATSLLKESTPLSVPGGWGPRHGSFVVSPTTGDTFFFLASELGNTVASYKVDYANNGTLAFHEVSRSSIYGGTATPANAAAAECLVSPDKRFVVTSSRKDSLFNISNPVATNGSTTPSDTLQSWRINEASGALTFDQLAPAGGRVPRQFSISPDGSFVAVGLQTDGWVVVMHRDVETGKLGAIVGAVAIAGGGVSSVIWA